MNINSIGNKFDLLANKIIEDVDVLVKSETKLDASFPIKQFKIRGIWTPFRRDRDQYSGGLLVFIRKVIPTPTEGICIKLSFRNKNWSSIVNEIIRAFLNPFFFFFGRTKSTKSTNTQPNKSTKTQISEQK